MQRVAMLSFHTCPASHQEGQETGGMNTYVWELSNALAASNLFIDIFTRRHDTQQPELVIISEHLRLIHLCAGPPKPMPIDSMVPHVSEFTEQLMTFIKNNGLIYTTFHCHYYLSGLIALKYNQMKQLTIPVIMNFHTLGLAKNQSVTDQKELASRDRIAIEKSLTQQARFVIANCTLDCRHIQHFHQMPSDRIAIISPGVNTSLFKPKISIHCLASNITHLLFVGRTQPIKGLDHLLAALQLLDQKKPGSFKLTIIGSDVAELKKKTTDLAISSAIDIIAQCNPETLATYYQSADLLILPSYYESFGMVALEAIACGTPAIVTQNCGIADLIKAHNKHWVIASNAPSLIAQTILDLINNPILMKSNLSVKQYSWSHIATAVRRLY